MHNPNIAEPPSESPQATYHPSIGADPVSNNWIMEGLKETAKDVSSLPYILTGVEPPAGTGVVGKTIQESKPYKYATEQVESPYDYATGKEPRIGKTLKNVASVALLAQGIKSAIDVTGGGSKISEYTRKANALEKMYEGDKKALLATGVIVGGATQSQAMGTKPLNDEDVIRSILGEAEGENFKSRQMHGEVIRRRGSLKGVYGLNAIEVRDGKYYRKGSKKPISDKVVEETRKAWELSKDSNLSQGATHWQSESDLEKSHWDKSDKFIVRIKEGGTTFLTEKRLISEQKRRK